MPEEDFLLNLFDKPKPSLCDKCKFAFCLGGGSVTIGLMSSSVPTKTYRQRYCSLKSESIAGSGYQECEAFDEAELIDRADTPEAGLLDLGDINEKSIKEFRASFRELLTSIGPFKIPVLYEHTKPEIWESTDGDRCPRKNQVLCRNFNG